MPSSPVRRARRKSAIALLAVLLLGVVAVAQAAHWPFYGGDQGRSGYQPLDEAGVPVTQVDQNTAATEDDVQNSIITTGGPLADRLYAFGTEEPGTATPTGNVHLQDLETGAPGARPEPGANVDDNADDEDSFRGLNVADDQNDFRRLEGQGVSFADATPAGQQPSTLYVVHNDDNQDGTNDISIAQIREDLGLEQQEFTVPGTDRFTIASSPVLGPQRPGAGTDVVRDLFFVARSVAQTTSIEDPCGAIGDPCAPAETRLFKVTITNPQSISATFSAPAESNSVVVPAGNPLASPSLANLTTIEGEGDTATPTTELYVIQGADNGQVFTFEADSLAAGPAADLPDDGDAQTVSVPVENDGDAPASATALFVAVGDDTGSNPVTENNGTTVYRLRVEPVADGVDTLVPATTGDDDAPTGTSARLAGSPSVALAVDFANDAPGEGGHVVVTTSNNLYVLDANDLREGTRLSFNDNRTAGGSGFSRNTAAASGGLAFVQEDDGTPLVIDLDDAQPVADGEFQEFPDHVTSTSALGQPSISARFVQFATNLGTFVYRTTQPTLSVGDVQVVEGDTGTGTATFTVALSGPAQEQVTVNYTTASGTATEGADFQDATGQLIFAPGQTTKTVQVTINRDTADEADETFTLTLSGNTGAGFTDSSATGTILDDDTGQPNEPNPPNDPNLAISDASVVEGDTGTRELTFTLSLSDERETGTVTADYATANDTATAGSDYTAETGTVTFAAGETEKTVTVTVRGDTVDEGTEQFFVNLSDVAGATPSDTQGVGTISDDDEPTPATPAAPAVINVDDATVAETDGPGAATFTVTLTRTSPTPVGVDFTTAPGTATTPGDFSAVSGRLTFAPGQTSQTVTVPIAGDDANEPTETFELQLGNASGAAIGSPSGLGTIVDDDVLPRVVEPARVNPRGITARTTPGRDRSIPFRFRTAGRILLPQGVSRSSACIGVVSIQIKRGSNTVSTRRAEVRTDCSYSSTVTFDDRARIGKGSARLRVTVRFLGNPRLNRITSRSQLVRFG